MLFCFLFLNETQTELLFCRFTEDGNLLAPEVVTDLFGIQDELNRYTIMFIAYKMDHLGTPMYEFFDSTRIEVMNNETDEGAAEFVRQHAASGQLNQAAGDLLQACLIERKNRAS